MHWFLLLISLAPAAPAAPIDRVMYDVGGDLVLASDLVIEDLLATVDHMGTPFWSAMWGPAEERLVDSAVIRRVASEVGIYDPDAAAVAARLDGVRNQLAGEAAYRSFLAEAGVDEASLTAIVRRREMVDRYLLRNLRTNPEDLIAWRAEAKDHVRRLRSRVPIREIRLRRAPTPP